MFCKNSKNYNILINKKIIENILADLNSWGQTKDIFCSFFTENRRTFWGVCGLFIDSIWRDILSLTDSTYCLSPTEEEVIQEKAKVVAVSCGTEMLQFLAALAILHQDVNELKNSGQIRLFFNSNQCKIASAARNWIKFVPPRSSDDLLPSLLYKSLFPEQLQIAAAGHTHRLQGEKGACTGQGQCQEIVHTYLLYIKKKLYLGLTWTGKNGFAKFFVFEEIFAKTCVRVVVDYCMLIWCPLSFWLRGHRVSVIVD